MKNIIIAAHPYAIRQAMKQLFASPDIKSLPNETREKAEIVLVETLNNIVQHAYENIPDGKIKMAVKSNNNHLECEITDTGAPMKNIQPSMAVGSTPNLSALPEQGFGRYLIHKLTHNIHYERRGSQNRLRLSIQ